MMMMNHEELKHNAEWYEVCNMNEIKYFSRAFRRVYLEFSVQ